MKVLVATILLLVLPACVTPEQKLAERERRRQTRCLELLADNAKSVPDACADVVERVRAAGLVQLDRDLAQVKQQQATAEAEQERARVQAARDAANASCKRRALVRNSECLSAGRELERCAALLKSETALCDLPEPPAEAQSASKP